MLAFSCAKLSVFIRFFTRGISPFSYFCRLAIRSVGEKSLGSFDIALDLGAGSSPYRAYFNSLYPQTRYLSVDFAEASGLSVVADVMRLPFKNECSDVVLSFDVIQHVPNPEEMVRESYRVLRPNGILVISYPFLYAECDAKDFSRWTRSGFDSLLTRNNFRVCVHKKRGGPFFLFLTGLIWAIQNGIPGRPKGWRTKGSFTRARAVVLSILCFPLILISWVALFMDCAIPSAGAYIGCWVIAEKQSI